MLGEDSNTCMGVRARQKGSNRGLLSMLLHGNCRILGLKDSHGRLTARAVARLLIDDATSLPVLYIETPYGSVDEDSYVAVSGVLLLVDIVPLINPVAAIRYLLSSSSHAKFLNYTKTNNCKQLFVTIIVASLFLSRCTIKRPS